MDTLTAVWLVIGLACFLYLMAYAIGKGLKNGRK